MKYYNYYVISHGEKRFQSVWKTDEAEPTVEEDEILEETTVQDYIKYKENQLRHDIVQMKELYDGLMDRPVHEYNVYRRSLSEEQKEEYYADALDALLMALRYNLKFDKKTINKFLNVKIKHRKNSNN